MRENKAGPKRGNLPRLRMSLKLFFVLCSSTADAHPVCCMDVFVKGDNACKVTCAVHLTKIRVKRLSISRPSWYFRDR